MKNVNAFLDESSFDDFDTTGPSVDIAKQRDAVARRPEVAPEFTTTIRRYGGLFFSFLFHSIYQSPVTATKCF